MPTFSENPQELCRPGRTHGQRRRERLLALGASNFLTGSDEPKSGQTPKPELLVRHGIDAEPGQADVQTPPIDATPTILYAKPVCYEQLHTCASSKLAQERINRESFTPADELILSLDPASLCTTPMALEGLPLKVTPPHGMSEVPATYCRKSSPTRNPIPLS